MWHQGVNVQADLNAKELRTAFESLGSGWDCREIVFRDDCSWKPWTLVAAALWWALSDHETLTGRFTDARKITAKAFKRQQELATSYQAFMKMLSRWTSQLCAAWSVSLQTQMKAIFDASRVEGRVLFGVDGTRIDLPRTGSNQSAYCPLSVGGRRRRRRSRNPRSTSARKKAETPSLWLTLLWHAGTGLPWCWRQGRSDASEREHLLKMIDLLPPQSMVTADAGFVGYGYWTALLEAGHELVVRVGSNVKLLKKLGYARESNRQVFLWPDRAAARQLPPLVLRLVVLHNGKHPVYLVTNVLSPKDLSDSQVGKIYRARWGIEVFYRSFKQTYRRRKLLAHSAAHARVELEWSLMALWSSVLYARSWQEVSTARVSVALVLRAFRQTMHEYRSRPDPGEELVSLLATAVQDEYSRANKSSRDYPRKKRERPPGAPQFVTASRVQVAAAKALRRQTTKKG